MFVLADGPADLFILYPPGSRGDFLAAILKDQLHYQYKNYSINSPENYQKAHWSKDIITEPIHQFKHKIRIRLKTFEEYLTVIYLWQEKIDRADWASIAERLLQNENDDFLNQKSVDEKFDHVIHFENLYDVDYIKDLYQKINHRELDKYTVDLIQYNINLQPWITLSNCKL
jgi:hypothetical protein